MNKPFIGTFWFSCVVGCPNCNDGDCAMWDIPLNDDKVRCSTCGYKMTKEEFKRREKEALAKKGIAVVKLSDEPSSNLHEGRASLRLVKGSEGRHG